MMPSALPPSQYNTSSSYNQQAPQYTGTQAYSSVQVPAYRPPDYAAYTTQTQYRDVPYQHGQQGYPQRTSQPQASAPGYPPRDYPERTPQQQQHVLHDPPQRQLQFGSQSAMSMSYQSG